MWAEDSPLVSSPAHHLWLCPQPIPTRYGYVKSMVAIATVHALTETRPLWPPPITTASNDLPCRVECSLRCSFSAQRLLAIIQEVELSGAPPLSAIICGRGFSQVLHYRKNQMSRKIWLKLSPDLSRILLASSTQCELKFPLGLHLQLGRKTSGRAGNPDDVASGGGPGMKLRRAFQLLGLRQDSATASEVKEAYISLVKKHHPDSRSPHADSEKFTEVR